VLSDEDGFSWIHYLGVWPALDTFAEPCAAVIDALARWSAQTGAPVETVDVMGFSQGAALCYALAAFYPQRIGRVLALAGFLPVEETLPGRYAALQNKQVYIAHGTRDETVPVTMAEEAARTLSAVGAHITYCASDTGHKLGANCLKGIEAFFKNSPEA
jgi:phospholipase/carboxylesterase